MFNELTGLAMGLVIFAITIGVGVVVLTKFGDTMANCASGFNYSGTVQLCTNVTNSTHTGTPTGQWTLTQSMISDLGTSGLAGWTAAIIALAVGLLFIVSLTGKRRY